MQNKYFGDIHDFYKFLLLKRISRHFPVGIHWCLVPDEKKKKDGEKWVTEKEKKKDAQLYKLLKDGKGKSISKIKSYLPPGTKYFDGLHEHYHLNSEYQKAAFDKLRKKKIIFFDPDNGLEVKSMTNKTRYKYLSYDMLVKFWENGNSMIVYQHLGRDKKAVEEKKQYIEELLKCSWHGNILFLRKSHVDYIFIIQKRHRVLHDIVADFVSHNQEYRILEYLT